MSWLWPIRTGQTVVDVWSVCHLCFWVVYGFNFWAVCLRAHYTPPWWVGYTLAVAAALLFALAWELLEGFYLEKHGWVLFKEIWFNRWLSDPLMAVLGTALGLYLVRLQGRGTP
jgi:hypothetical protein